MGVRRAIGSGLAAIALTALSASAQIVTYSTSGVLTGTGCALNTCTSDGFTLTFSNAASASYIAPTLVDLGQFVTQTNGSNGPTTFSDISFTLMITQTAPTGGSSVFSGSISGQLRYDPSSSSLVWTPTNTSTTIGSVTYVLRTDDVGNIGIQAPATGANQNPNPTSVKADITATPEPATALLLAPGLAGMGVAAGFRRRRSSK